MGNGTNANQRKRNGRPDPFRDSKFDDPCRLGPESIAQHVGATRSCAPISVYQGEKGDLTP
jgi:hypothetical protein